MKSKIFYFNTKFKKNSFGSLNNLVFKPILRSAFLDTSEKAILYAYAFPYFKSSVSKFKSICIDTGRSRGVLSKFFLSRITFKKYVINGQMVGFKKSRWLLTPVLFLYRGLIPLFRSVQKPFRFLLQSFLLKFLICFTKKDTFLIISVTPD